MIAHALYECGVAHVPTFRPTHLLDHGTHVAHDGVQLVRGEQVGHLATVQHAVHVLEERFLDDLGVGEQEHRVRALHAGGDHQLLQVLPELHAAVAPRQLDLDALVLRNGGRQPSQRLLAAASHAHKHGVAAGLSEHTAQACDVLHSILEEHQGHGVGVGQVVLLQVVVEQRHDLRHVAALLVQSLLRAGAHVVREHDRRTLEQVLVVPRQAEIPRQQVDDELREPSLVLRVDEAVMEHAHGLVDPQPRRDLGLAALVA